MGYFNARIGEVVGNERGSRNREGTPLIEWIESMDLWVVNGSPVAKGRWTWMNGQRRSLIDYILIGGAYGENDILEMRVEDMGGVEIPTDHKLVWININGKGARSDDNVCSGWGGGVGLGGSSGIVEWERGSGGLEGLEGCERVERVWEDYVQGFHSTRGLFRRRVASKRKPKGG